MGDSSDVCFPSSPFKSSMSTSRGMFSRLQSRLMLHACSRCKLLIYEIVQGSHRHRRRALLPVIESIKMIIPRPTIALCCLL